MKAPSAWPAWTPVSLAHSNSNFRIAAFCTCSGVSAASAIGDDGCVPPQLPGELACKKSKGGTPRLLQVSRDTHFLRDHPLSTAYAPSLTCPAPYT